MKEMLREKAGWLYQQTKRIIQGCRQRAFDGVTDCYTPDASGCYGAMWTRDFYYIVDGVPECIDDAMLRRCCDYLLGGQREDGVIPDRRYANGVSVYSAGPFDRPLGLPPADNAQFMVLLVAAYVRRSGDAAYANAVMQKLLCALNTVPLSGNGLVTISPDAKRPSYGFLDQILLTGEVFFASLLLIEAYDELAWLLHEIGDDQTARGFAQKRTQAADMLERLWSDADGMYLAATHDCRQADVWGSAYAVYAGIAPPERARRISGTLAERYDRYVSHGQVRHLFVPEVWERKMGLLLGDGAESPAPGTYQNGAYWSTASGWVSAAIRQTDDRLADRMLYDLLCFFQERGIYEAFNFETGYWGAKDYCASATLTVKELRRVGIDFAGMG